MEHGMWWQGMWTGKASVGRNVNAVSYTHLDVYKRQVVTMSGNGGTEPQQGDNFTDDSIMGSWGE